VGAPILGLRIRRRDDVWVNHRRCLRAIGGDRSEYYGEVAFEISRFLRRLFNPAQTRNEPVSIGIAAPALPNGI
jgi:hypothetical protein